MSKGGGGGGSTTTVQKADPWVGLQQPLQQLYGGAQKWYQSGGPQYFPGQTVAGTNGAINDALSQGTAMAEQGPSQAFQQAQSSLGQQAAGTSMQDNPAFGQLGAFGSGNYMGTNPAQGYLQDATAGKYLTPDSNPYMQGMYQAATRPMVSQFQNSIAPALASQFSAAGRMGSGAHEAAFGQATDSLGRALGDTANNMFGNAYQQERGLQQGAATSLGQLNANERGQQLSADQTISGAYGQNKALQQSAAGMLPQFESMKYDNLNKLLGIGQYEQGNEQAQIDANKQRWDTQQQQPLQNLQALNQLLQGGSVYASGTSTGQNQTNRNPFAGAVGGAAVGNALGSALGLGTGPAGALSGLLLGGLFG